MEGNHIGEDAYSMKVCDSEYLGKQVVWTMGISVMMDPVHTGVLLETHLCHVRHQRVVSGTR